MTHRFPSLPRIGAFAAAVGAALLAGCFGTVDDTAAAGSSGSSTTNSLPSGITEVGTTTYAATATTAAGTGTTAATQDLLTAGLGTTWLASATAPAYADPANPTALELRRSAIYSNYRGLVDPTPAGGFGVFYGPNVDVSGNVNNFVELVPGRESIAVLDDAGGTKRVVIAVQVPDSFSTASPCLVLGPSSGSRGVYGAIATSAEWGLKHGCAVALTDAGKGVGLYDLSDDTVNRVDGTRATRTAAGALAQFVATLADAARTAYVAAFPNRVALKQVHSQLNPEKDWGNDTLAAARYAFYVLNARYATTANAVPFTATNTVVIAGSVSNGGTAVIRAAEADTDGLIDGVVAGEPVTEMPNASGYGITFGGVAVTGFGRRLADYTTYGNLYQPCAALAVPAALAETSFYNYLDLTAQTNRATARCTSLATLGLVSGGTTAARALDALNKLRAYGWTTDNDTMHNAHYGLGNGPILSAMYPWSYGRFPLTDNVCNTSFAQVDATGAPIAFKAADKAASFAIENGTANGGANGTTPAVVYDNSVGGPKVWNLATSPSTGAQDFGLDNALCQRALVTGVDETGAALGATPTSTRPTAVQATAVQNGINDILVNGNLRGKPALIVAGRSDALVPVNNNARAYTAYNRVVEGTASRLGYIEVTSAQHFDSFLALTAGIVPSGFETRFVPLHLYFVRAMDAMWSTLKSGVALPPSQVVRTVPRGGAPGQAPALTAAAVPGISAAPATADRIGSSGTSLTLPN